MQDATLVTATKWKPPKLQRDLVGLTNTYTVDVPSIMSTTAVQQDEHLTLRQPKKLVTWVDEVSASEEKRRIMVSKTW